MLVHNVHERVLPRSRDAVFAELEALGTPHDRIWPKPSMPFTRTPGPMVVGETRERHGIIAATLSAFEPLERITWQASLPFLRGTHAFELTREGFASTRVAHVLHADVALWFMPVWKFKVARIHDRLIEGLFDRLCSALA